MLRWYRMWKIDGIFMRWSCRSGWRKWHKEQRKNESLIFHCIVPAKASLELWMINAFEERKMTSVAGKMDFLPFTFPQNMQKRKLRAYGRERGKKIACRHVGEFKHKSSLFLVLKAGELVKKFIQIECFIAFFLPIEQQFSISAHRLLCHARLN